MCSVLVGVWVWNVLKDLKATAWVFCFPDPDSNGKDKWKWIARWLDSNLRTKALKTLSFKNIQTQLLITSKRCFFNMPRPHHRPPLPSPPPAFRLQFHDDNWYFNHFQHFHSYVHGNQHYHPDYDHVHLFYGVCDIAVLLDMTWARIYFACRTHPKKTNTYPPKQNTNKIKRLLFFNRCFLFFYPFPGVIFKGLPVF